MKGRPSAASPTCQMGTMLSCSTAAAARASRVKRARSSLLAARAGFIVLIAALRPRRVSSAR